MEQLQKELLAKEKTASGSQMGRVPEEALLLMLPRAIEKL